MGERTAPCEETSRVDVNETIYDGLERRGGGSTTETMPRSSKVHLRRQSQVNNMGV